MDDGWTRVEPQVCVENRIVVIALLKKSRVINLVARMIEWN